MSPVQVAFLRLAVLYLVATGALGVLFLIDPRWVGAFRVAHVHAGVLGFFLSLVMGVAFWLLPRPGGRRWPGMEAWAFGLFHGGLALRLLMEPWWRSGGPAALQAPVVTGSLATLGGMAVFAVAVWRRAVTPEALRRAREHADT